MNLRYHVISWGARSLAILLKIKDKRNSPVKKDSCVILLVCLWLTGKKHRPFGKWRIPWTTSTLIDSAKKAIKWKDEFFPNDLLPGFGCSLGPTLQDCGCSYLEGRGRGQEIFLQLSEVEECNNPFLASDLMDASHIKKEQRNTLPPVLECNAPFQAFSLC